MPATCLGNSSEQSKHCSYEAVIHSLGETVINKCYQMAGGDKCGEKNEAGIGSAEDKDLGKQAFIRMVKRDV